MNQILINFMKDKGYADHVINRGMIWLISNWTATVNEIKNGYDMCWEEYLNDIDSRQIIHECYPYCTAEEKALYDQKLVQADKEFLSATIPIESCVWGTRAEKQYKYSREVNWWYYRISTYMDEAPEYEPL